MQVTLEAIDVENNRTLWRDTLNLASQNLIAMREQVEAKVRQSLVPVLSASATASAGTTHPKNEEAYDLYLRSAAVPYDPTPNKQAIAMLERSVGLDETYAPAWNALGLRYNWDAYYSDGGEAAFHRSSTAFERAVVLDPNLISAVGYLSMNLVDRGELEKAADAEARLKSHPENASAHFSLAYVYRYAGLLEDSVRECDAALALDPGNWVFRSCSQAFFELGKTDKALQYLRLDPGSEYAANLLPGILLREGKTSEASVAAERMSKGSPWYGGLLQTCLQRPSEMAAAVRENKTALLAERDPEIKYYQASILAFCGQQELALALLHSAIQENYCAVSALNADPLWAKLRDKRDFGELRAEASECQKKFLAHRK